jgi:hypothetical protein
MQRFDGLLAHLLVVKAITLMIGFPVLYFASSTKDFLSFCEA